MSCTRGRVVRTEGASSAGPADASACLERRGRALWRLLQEERVVRGSGSQLGGRGRAARQAGGRDKGSHQRDKATSSCCCCLLGHQVQRNGRGRPLGLRQGQQAERQRNQRLGAAAKDPAGGPESGAGRGQPQRDRSGAAPLGSHPVLKFPKVSPWPPRAGSAIPCCPPRPKRVVACWVAGCVSTRTCCPPAPSRFTAWGCSAVSC